MKRTLVERVDVSLLEEVSRLMARQYWRGRGEEITDEMEDEFWLSFAKDADAIIAMVRQHDRQKGAEK